MFIPDASSDQIEIMLTWFPQKSDSKKSADKLTRQELDEMHELFKV